MRVLIVEDDPSVAVMLGVLLTELGHEVTVRDHEFPALLRWRQTTDPDWKGIDVLLCDVLLPGTHGARILEHSKAHYPKVRRVALSGVDDSTLNDIRKIAHAVLQKPATIEEIELAIEGNQ